MSKTIDQINQELSSKIPRDVIEQRDGGGRKLSYLPGWYVIDRLNAIFGADGWSYDTTELRCVHSGEITTRSGTTNSASYTATVALYVQFPGTESAKRITDVGFGNGTDKGDPGKPHELATKEAVTDGIKRCAKSLGNSLGLALYDKSQENVEDAPETSKPQAASKPNRSVINDGITANAKVAINKGLYTKESFQAFRKERYAVDSTDALTDSQADELLTLLKKEVKDGKRA